MTRSTLHELVTAAARSAFGLTVALAAPQREAFELDRRLRRKSVGLPADVDQTLSDALKLLSEACAVRLVCEYSLARRRAAIAVTSPRPVTEWMRALATSAFARWVRVGQGYALTRIPALSHLAGLDEEALTEARVRSARALFESLDATQLARLERGEKIAVEELGPVQQAHVREAAAAAVEYGAGWYSPSGLDGSGAYLQRSDHRQEFPDGSFRFRRVIKFWMPSDILGVEEIYEHELP